MCILLIPYSWRDASWVGISHWIPPKQTLSKSFCSEVLHSCNCCGLIQGHHHHSIHPSLFILGPFQVILSVLSTKSRIIFKRALKIWMTYCSVRQLTSKTWPSQFLFSPWHQCTWLLFYELLSWLYSGICLGRVHWITIWMVGWALCLSLILGMYQAFCFCILMFLSDLVLCALMNSFCLVLHAGLCRSHVLHCCVERHRPDPASPRIILTVHFCPPVLYFLFYLRYKLVKVHSFNTSLTLLEPGHCHNKPLHYA